MPYIESAGASIYWEVRGQGEPLLLIVGLGGASDQWYRIAPALSARFQTLLFDNRGIGRSGVPPPPYSIEGMADDAAAVLDAAGVSSAHVFGNSMGGMIAQELTLRHPTRVRSLILGCTACGGRASVPAAKEVRAALNPDPSLSREEAFWAAAWSIYDPSTLRSLLEEDLAVRMRVARTAEGYSAQYQAIRAWQGTHDRLGTIRVPTLVLHGENDLLIPPANAEILARAIPGAKLVMLPGAAHIYLTDALEPARDVILSFLETCVASAVVTQEESGDGITPSPPQGVSMRRRDFLATAFVAGSVPSILAQRATAREAGQAASPVLRSVQVLVFDTFGTVVDWRSSVIAEGEQLGRAKGVKVDWAAFADAWRAGYSPAMNRVRRGELPWTKLDELHRMTLNELLVRFKVEGLTEDEKVKFNRVWHRLKPWSDSVAGLTRLRKQFVIAPLSNGNLSLLTNMAKFGNLPWDCILSTELVRHYKPDKETYLMPGEFFDVKPEAVMMVAAHGGDLDAAKALGLKTAYVHRPLEYGPGRKPTMPAAGRYDFVSKDFRDLASQLGV